MNWVAASVITTCTVAPALVSLALPPHQFGRLVAGDAAGSGPARVPGQDGAGDSAHVTNEIQEFVKRGAGVGTPDAVDVAIVEIGGTVGDIESLPFLEAVRQMSLKLGPGNYCFAHLTLRAFHRAAGELKTKPTQHTVQKLREIGIQADAAAVPRRPPHPR
jgi:hypothetical protein